MAWTLEGTYFENCSCDTICPCTWSGLTALTIWSAFKRWRNTGEPRVSILAPSMSFALRIAETSGQKVEAIALRCQIRIEPARRRYSDAEAERLNDLFGETQRWADTLKPLQFTTVSVMVPGFTGSTELDLPVMLSYDMEIGATRYFAGLEEGDAF